MFGGGDESGEIEFCYGWIVFLRGRGVGSEGGYECVESGVL